MRAFVLAIVALVALAGPVLAQGVPIYGTREVRNGNLSAFTKWTGVIGRQRAEPPQYGNPCAVRRGGQCRILPEWRQLVDQLRGRPVQEQLDAVNAFHNRIPYVEDIVNWGISDYWATPFEFLGRNGDCEDYAIAKYITLRELGMPVSQMRILVLNDLNLRVPHAVLIVYVGSQAMLLDNQISRVVPHNIVRHYQPIFSINEEAWWLHQR